MKYVKYCRSEHNIYLDSQTVQLGTLDYYREMDPSFSIADPDEGISGIKSADNSKVEINVDNKHKTPWGNALKAGAMSIDGQIHTIAPNLYMFSLETVAEDEMPSAEKANQYSTNYDSAYVVEDITGFRRSLLGCLSKQVLIGDLNDHSIELLKSRPMAEAGFNIASLDQPIEYVDDKILPVTSETLDQIEDWNRASTNSVFRKPKKYENEKEQRLIFPIKHPSLGVLSMHKVPKILSITPFTEFGYAVKF